MASAQNIANFRESGRNLILVTGYMYECNDQINALLREREKETDEQTPADARYYIVMFEKGEKINPVSRTSAQRNIYVRHDLEKNIFVAEATQNVWKPTPEELQTFPHARETPKYDIYFFEDGNFMTVADDYVKLEEWLLDQNTQLDISVRPIKTELEKFIANTNGDPFNATRLHTTRLTR